MNTFKKTTSTLIIGLLSFLSCKEPFVADSLFEETNFLVVEGYINVGAGPTTLRLSRTAEIESEETISREQGAMVTIEDQNGTASPLAEHSDGIYAADLNLPADKQYRVRIVTATGKTYVSDLATPKLTPEIDSLFSIITATEVQVLLATHDAQGNTNYYQWELEEAWEINSNYPAGIKYEDRKLKYILPETADSLFICYKYDERKDLPLYSTTALSEDRVAGFLTFRIPKNDERLSVKYSVLARQHALTREAYEYFTLMKKNTGPLGSFSDPQPSELFGNIRCIDSDEPVIGYITASSTTSKLKFVFPSNVPDWNYNFPCSYVDTSNHPDTLLKYLESRRYTPMYPLVIDGNTGQILTFRMAESPCVDCHYREGSSLRPPYWD